MTAQASKCQEEVKLVSEKMPQILQKSESKLLNEARKTSEIKFVRNRMFYARPALNGNGGVRLGLRHIRKSFSNNLIIL
jgi:hypothetical protein